MKHLLALLLLSATLSAQTVVELNLNAKLDNATLSPKEAHFLYTKALNLKLTVESNLRSLEQKQTSIQQRLDFLAKREQTIGLSQKDKEVKASLEKELVVNLTQLESMRTLKDSATTQIEFLHTYTPYTFEFSELIKTYEISPLKNPYPVVHLPVIDDTFKLKLAPDLSLAIPVEF